MRLRFGGLAVCGLLVAAAPSLAVDKDEVKAAIAKGVAYLKQQQRPDGSWLYTELRDTVQLDQNVIMVGATALVGLTLVECEVPTDDAAVQKAAEFVRRGSVKLTSTYVLSLAIMFLDRLGDPDDVRLIQSMGVRLLAGQTTEGGWSYHCPDVSPDEAARLLTALQQRTELRTKRPKAKPGEQKQRPTLPKDIQKQLQGMGQRAWGGRGGDNSNTQFAILALWVARRHGVPVEQALALVDTRFRGSQNRDGGWSYAGLGNRGGAGFSSPAMTCAGLLGLAVAHGVASETALRTNPGKARNTTVRAVTDPNRDPAVRAGLIALAQVIGKPTGKKTVLGQVRQPGWSSDGNIYYFLWSLERVAVVYGLTTIGNKDWYGWGSEFLLDYQGAQGAWNGKYGFEVDTCFALLFLRRANLAGDLTATLKGRVQDPGEARLTARGVGANKPPPAKSDSGPDKRKSDTPVAKNPPAKSESGKTPSGPASDDDQAKVARLRNDLVSARGTEQERLVEQYRDAKGYVYTDALAAAIPELAGETKTKARDALAERLSRMTAPTLRKKLKEESAEIRRAAALACAMKEDRQHIPDLIEALEDREMSVVLAARTGLKHLTKQDFGPRKDATPAERAKAVEEWKVWLKDQQG